jgi:hypothetical protein
LAEVAELSGKPARIVDGEMTSWYGPRAIVGLGYMTKFAANI